MQRQFTSGSRQTPDPCDQYLEENNFYRKHTARDASCLFRVISEQIYDSQLHHLDVRRKCVEFMRKYSHYFQHLVDRDLDEYLDELSKPKTFASLVELRAIGYLYRRNIILFQPFDLGNFFIQNDDYQDVIRVFYTPERHFDSVFTADYIKDAAICQGICYEIVYKDLFKLPDVAFAVEQMLHSSSLENTSCRTDFNDDGYCVRLSYVNGQEFHLDLPQDTNCILENHQLCHFHAKTSYSCVKSEKVSTNTNIKQLRMETERDMDSLLPDKFISCVRQLLMEGITPFPYKVAKALDPNMYRNIEFDAWNEARKEMKFQNWYTGDTNFKVGAKCYVRLNCSENELYTCHIQDITADRKSCTVFIEQTGEKRMVPYESLTPLPIDQFQPWTPPYRSQRNVHRYNGIHYSARQYNYRLKMHGHCTSPEYLPAVVKPNANDSTNQNPYVAAVTSAMATHQNDCFYNVHLENYRAQTVQYCAMPMPLDHATNMPDTTLNGQAMQEIRSTPHPIDNDNDRVPGNGGFEGILSNGNSLIPADAGAVKSIDCSDEMEHRVAKYAPDSQYIYHMQPDDFYSYPNIQPVAAFVPTTNGGTYYYMANPVPAYPPPINYQYIQPPTGLHTRPVLHSGLSTLQIGLQACNNAYANVAPQQQPTPGYMTQSTYSVQSSQLCSDISVNLNARRSMKLNGSDLPCDIATLRYFYNLGVDFHMNQSSHQRENEKPNETKTIKSHDIETANREQLNNGETLIVDDCKSCHNTPSNSIVRNCQNCKNAPSGHEINRGSVKTQRRINQKPPSTKTRTYPQRPICDNIKPLHSNMNAQITKSPNHKKSTANVQSYDSMPHTLKHGSNAKVENSYCNGSEKYNLNNSNDEDGSTAMNQIHPTNGQPNNPMYIPFTSMMPSPQYYSAPQQNTVIGAYPQNFYPYANVGQPLAPPASIQSNIMPNPFEDTTMHENVVYPYLGYPQSMPIYIGPNNGSFNAPYSGINSNPLPPPHLIHQAPGLNTSTK